MKKILASTVATLLAVSMFTACGSSDSSSSAADSKETTTTTTTTAAPEESKAEESTADSTVDSTADSSADDFITVESDGENTVFTQRDGPSDAWAAGFTSATFVADDGTESTGTDYIDARSLEKDRDLHVTIEYEWTKTFLDMVDAGVKTEDQIYMVIGPCFANGWEKFGSEISGLKCDYPMISDGKVYINGEEDSSYTVDGEAALDADGNKVDVYVKDDGFIQVNKLDITQVEFTIPAEIVNKMIENANAEDGWDGVLMQIGGNFAVTKVTVDEPNAQLASKYVAPDAQ